MEKGNKKNRNNKSFIGNYFGDWNLYEKIWLIVFTLLIIFLSIYWEDSLIGIIASLTGIWCVVLVAKQRISNYYVGIVNVILYAYVAYQWKYYGEVMLNILYFLPMQFIGLYIWIKNKNNAKVDTVRGVFMSNNQRLFWIIVTIVGIIFYGIILKIMGGSMPYTDSASTVLSVIAMILMVLRYVEQWVLWILVDVLSIILWLNTLFAGGNDIAILLMWIGYLVNAIYGLINWTIEYKKGE